MEREEGKIPGLIYRQTKEKINQIFNKEWGTVFKTHPELKENEYIKNAMAIRETLMAQLNPENKDPKINEIEEIIKQYEKDNTADKNKILVNKIIKEYEEYIANKEAISEKGVLEDSIKTLNDNSLTNQLKEYIDRNIYNKKIENYYIQGHAIDGRDDRR